MVKRVIILFLICIIIVGCSASKNLKNRAIKSGTIVYKTYRDLTDYDVDKDLKLFNSFIGSDSTYSKVFNVESMIGELKTKSNSINFDKNGSISKEFWMALQKDTTLTRFEVYPEFYFIPDYLKTRYTKDEQYKNGKFFHFGTRVNRKSLESCFSTREKNCNRIKHSYVSYDERYDIELLKNDRKIISGYNCFKINLKDKKTIDLSYELYVTEDINLNYNPLMNLETLNDNGYFILEKTQNNKNQKMVAKAISIDLNGIN